MRTSSSIVLATLALFAALAHAEQPPAALPAGAVRVAAGTETFGPGKPPFPASVQVAILDGDPTKSGQFTARVKLPAKFTLPPHTHSVVERTTVLSGAVYVGFGKVVDKTKATKLGAGSFYVNPKGAPHFVMTDDETVIQISTEGPWDVTKVK